MFLRMMFRQMSLAQRLTALGWLLVGLGVLLALVRLVMLLSYLAGIVALVGLGVLLVGGYVARREKGRRYEIEDEIPHL